MVVSWLSPYLSDQYLYDRDKEIEKALADCGYDMKTTLQLMREGRMVWYRGINNHMLEEINAFYLDGRELFQIIGQNLASGPRFKKVVFERKKGKT